MRNILFIHNCSDIGGGSFCLLNLIKNIDRTQFIPSVLLCEEGPLVNELKEIGVKVFYCRKILCVPYNRSFFYLGTSYTYLQVFSSIFSFKKKIIEINPDIIYFNTSLLYPYLRVVKRLKKIAVIHIREHWPLEEHKLQLQALKSYISIYSDKIFAINDYCKKMVETERNLPVVVHDWIDFSDRYKKFDMNKIFDEDVDEKKIFLFTGGRQAIKGAYEVLKTFSSLPNDDYRLLVVGINPSTINVNSDNEYNNLLNKMLVEDHRIKCIPATYHLKDIIQKSYCTLSFFTIPHANLILAESILLGTPVIAAKTEESIEYSKGGSLANLFEFGNLNAFKKSIIDIENTRESLLQSLIKNSSSVSEMFDRQLNVNIFNNVLLNIN